MVIIWFIYVYVVYDMYKLWENFGKTKEHGGLPSGKRLHNSENHHVEWENSGYNMHHKSYA